MITKKSYIIYKPINIDGNSGKYFYEEITIKINVFYLFGFIPIYKIQETTDSEYLSSYFKPKIRKLI